MNKKIFISVNLSLLFLNLLFFTLIAKHPERIGTPDEYSKIAQGIAFSGKYIRHPIPYPETEDLSSNYMKWADINNNPDSIRMPGYPVFLSLFYKIFGYEKRFPVFANILLRLVTINIIFLMFYTTFNPHMAIFFGIISALDISSLVYTFYLTTEILFTFFLVLSIFSYKKFSISSDKRYLFLTFFLSGICVLIRAIAIFFPLILLIGSILKDRRYSLKIILCFFIALSWTVGPWVYRNYKVFNVPGLTAISGFNMFYYNAGGAYLMKYPGSSWEDAEQALEKKYAYVIESEDFKKKNSFEKSVILGNLGKQYIMENKIDYIKAHLKGTVFSLMQIAGRITFLITGKFKGTGIFASMFFKTALKKDLLLSIIFTLYNLFLLFVYFMALKGCIELFKRYKDNNFNCIIFFTILYFMFLPGPCGLLDFDRFRVPVMPFILFLASYGLFGGKCEKSSGGNACV